MIIYFDLENEKLASSIFKPIIDKQGKTAQIPPAWAFGHHMTVPYTISKGLIYKINATKAAIKYPLEGIIQETTNLD